MFKAFIISALSLAFIASTSSAHIIMLDGDEMGDTQMRLGVHTEMLKLQNRAGHDFRQQRDRLQKLKQSFHALTEPEITALFGSKVENKPNTSALPVYDSGVWVFPTRWGSSPDMRATSFYVIGDFAVAKIHYAGQRKNVAGILFYLRVDDSFPKLEGWETVKSRLKWESSRLVRIEDWVAQRRTIVAKPS